uniref:Uncharacterized protein n=1 Tax=Cyprinus carpio carpio TaxID=630221 RepID=A0A9J8AIW0_CYPCA
MEETFCGVSSVMESSLYHNVHSILRELDANPQGGSACNKGMLRWNLHNRVDKNPSISVSLLRVLIKELEKVCSSVILSSYRTSKDFYKMNQWWPSPPKGAGHGAR